MNSLIFLLSMNSERGKRDELSPMPQYLQIGLSMVQARSGSTLADSNSLLVNTSDGDPLSSLNFFEKLTFDQKRTFI